MNTLTLYNMKTTNEIEKQLERKADAYLEQKAKEMIAIRKQIEYHGYCNAEKADKTNYVSYHASHVIQNKLIDELAENYKERLVKKYTKELLTKLDIFK